MLPELVTIAIGCVLFLCLLIEKIVIPKAISVMIEINNTIVIILEFFVLIDLAILSPFFL
jgi:hypothetical protein